jgi:hypothetical protein
MRNVIHVYKLKDLDDHTADPQYYTINQLRDYGVDIHETWTEGVEFDAPSPTLEEIKTSDDKLIEFFEDFNFELEPISTVTLDDFNK